jgi:hypothetical protein
MHLFDRRDAEFWETFSDSPAMHDTSTDSPLSVDDRKFDLQFRKSGSRDPTALGHGMTGFADLSWIPGFLIENAFS